MKRILITGAGGFVGTYLIRALQANGGVEIFASVYHSTTSLTDLLPSDHIYEGDLTDPAFANLLLRSARPNLIYHLAALSVVHNSSDNAASVISSNSTLSYNLLESTRLHAPQARFLAICSANVYGLVDAREVPIKETQAFKPLNPYAISKIAQEMLALQYYLVYGLDIVILRPFNHTGVGQTTDFVIPALAAQLVKVERGQQAHISAGNLSTIRDFTDVRDMVQAYILAADHCQAGEAYNIGSGQGHSVQQIIDILRSLTTSSVTVDVQADRVRRGDVPVLIADATKFNKATTWSPQISLSTTISDILNHYRSLK